MIDYLALYNQGTFDPTTLTSEQQDEYRIFVRQMKWSQFKANITHFSDTRKREALYGFLRCKLVGDTLDGDLDESRPFYASLTVDEMSQRYVQYIGDDNEIALSCLTGKAEAKTYIRSLFGGQP